MKENLRFNIIQLMCAVVLFTVHAFTVQAQTGSTDNQRTVVKNGVVQAAGGPNLPVFGAGTVGQLSKWTGLTSTNSFLGDSIITETKLGNIGIGTTTPGSKLTIAGTIETTSGGVMFPDGTLQTTAGLSSVIHDTTLTGNGTAASPLGIATAGVGTNQLADNAVTTPKIADGAVVATKIAPATVVRSLNGLSDNVALAAGPGITLTPVGNTLTIATATADSEQNAFHRDVLIDINAGEDSGVGANTVPSGKRLVIEYLAIKATGDDPFGTVDFSTTVAGVSAIYQLLPVPLVNRISAIDKQVRIFADNSEDRFYCHPPHGWTEGCHGQGYCIRPSGRPAVALQESRSHTKRKIGGNQEK
jgi:hypothetical protein